MKKTSILLNQLIILFALSIIILAFQSCTDQVQDEPTSVKSEFNLSTAKTEIEEANKNLMALIAAGDSVGVANLYTADAKVMFAGAPSVVGRASIQSKFSSILTSGVTKINLETKEVFGNEDLLAEEGQVTVYVKDMAVAEEKYIILWKKEDGQWKLFRDIANSNSPSK
jgi:uncharacterized protein (TIGR02246 family)